MGRKKKQGVKLEVFSFSLDPRTIEGMDKIIAAKGFESRSSFVELILRTHILEVIKDGKI